MVQLGPGQLRTDFNGTWQIYRGRSRITVPWSQLRAVYVWTLCHLAGEGHTLKNLAFLSSGRIFLCEPGLDDLTTDETPET